MLGARGPGLSDSHKTEQSAHQFNFRKRSEGPGGGNDGRWGGELQGRGQSQLSVSKTLPHWGRGRVIQLARVWLTLSSVLLRAIPSAGVGWQIA